MQALLKLALEPEWESRFEANSYGFRPGRACQDAIEVIHATLSHQGSSQWVLDTDISGCFDNIDHQALLDRVPGWRETIRKWLKTGTVEMGQYHASDSGTPQGGVISPLLANIALDGLEREFGCEKRNGEPLSPAFGKGKNRGISLIRYADDFVVTAPTRETLRDYVIPKAERFLKARGLQLSQAKTRIVHVDEGFNFLGVEIRRFKGKLLAKPQKNKVVKHLRAIKAYLEKHRQTPAGAVIRSLNPIIRGWANYYRHGISSKTFSKVDHEIWKKLWRWAKRRHPGKPRKWVRKQYFANDGNWTFRTAEGARLLRHSATPITRYIKVIGKSSPMNPDQREYWEKRKRMQTSQNAYQKQRLTLLRTQNNCCGLCGVSFWSGDPIDEHHLTPRHKGGQDGIDNCMLVHRWCHHAHHQRQGYKPAEA